MVSSAIDWDDARLDQPGGHSETNALI